MNNEKYQINILKRGGNLAVHFYDEKGTEITELYMSIKDENSFCIEMNDVTDKKELIMKLSLETGNEATYSLSMNRIKNSSEKKLMNNYLINGIIYNRTIDDKTIEVYRRIQFITNPSIKVNYYMEKIEGNCSLYIHYCKTFPKCEYSFDTLTEAIPAKQIGNIFLYKDKQKEESELSSNQTVVLLSNM